MLENIRGESIVNVEIRVSIVPVLIRCPVTKLLNHVKLLIAQSLWKSRAMWEYQAPEIQVCE
jgi:hypothetical protein